MQFQYDPNGRLETIVDTLNRQVEFTYNPQGLLESVVDFTGRTYSYEYYQNGDAGGSFGDLKSATTPAVTGVPTGNNYPGGKTTTYSSAAPRIRTPGCTTPGSRCSC